MSEQTEAKAGELIAPSAPADSLDISADLEHLESALRSHIVKHATAIKFTQPLYTIEKGTGEGEYNITISITGLGRQEFKLLLLGEDFAFTGKLRVVAQDASFPVNLIADLVNSAIAKWLSQTTQQVAQGNAKKALKKVQTDPAAPKQLLTG